MHSHGAFECVRCPIRRTVAKRRKNDRWRFNFAKAREEAAFGLNAASLERIRAARTCRETARVLVAICKLVAGALLPYAPKLVCTWYRLRDRMTRFNASSLRSFSLLPLLFLLFFSPVSLLLFPYPSNCSFFYLREDHASAARSSRPFDLFSVKPSRRIRSKVSVARENAVQRDDGATNSLDSWKSGAERATDRSW